MRERDDIRTRRTQSRDKIRCATVVVGQYGEIERYK